MQPVVPPQHARCRRASVLEQQTWAGSGSVWQAQVAAPARKKPMENCRAPSYGKGKGGDCGCGASGRTGEEEREQQAGRQL